MSVAVVADGQRVEVAGTTFGPRHVPHLVGAYGQSFNIELMKHMAIFRYSDVPGMIGKIGTVFGEHGLNIASTAVGREPDHEPDQPAGGGSGQAGRDGRHHRLAGARRRDRARSSRSRASRTAAP